MFYTTCYVSKSTQYENTKVFQKEIKMSDEPDLDNDDTPVPEFVEGLFRLLCGISAQLNVNVVAVPMTHFIVICRTCFMFSHIFGNLLSSQVEDYIKDEQKIISFQIKTTHDIIA